MTFAPHTIDPDLDLELVRETEVAPELVWHAWTEPELLKQWFTPKPWETPVVEVDLRPGGKFHTVMRGPDGEENDNTGCFLEVDARTSAWCGPELSGPDSGRRPDRSLFTAIIELERTASGGTQLPRRSPCISTPAHAQGARRDGLQRRLGRRCSISSSSS